MPWHVARDQRCPPDRPFAVIADDSAEVVGCHATEDAARQQVEALYAQEPDAAEQAAAEPHACSCQPTGLGAEIAAGMAGLSIEDLAAGLVDGARAAALATAPFDTPFPVPEYPPADWFGAPLWIDGWRAEHGYGPSLDPETGILHLTVTDEGRFGAYFYDRGACIIHDHSACPNPSPTNYAAFHQQAVVLADGTTLQVGVIGNTHGHASPWVDYVQAQRHYADPDAQMILCRAGDDERGGWVAGCIVPGLTFGDVAMLRRCALSGDWRPMPATWWLAHGVPAEVVAAVDGFDCIGPTLVTRPALPLVSAFVASVGDHPTAILGGGGGVQLADDIESMFQPDPDGTVRFAQEVPAGMRTTMLNPDGSITITDSTPEEDLARERAATVAASLTGDLDLPLAPLDRAWDPDGAAARVMRFVTDDEARTANAAYLWREPGDDPVQYALGFADVIDGELHAVPAGIIAAANAVDEMPEHARTPLRANLDRLYARMADTYTAEHAPRAPWVAAPMEVGDDDGMMEDETTDDGAAATITVGEWNALNDRVVALEEFASAVIDSQVAAALAPDVSLEAAYAEHAATVASADTTLPADVLTPTP